MTAPEILLWSKLRAKQLKGCQFYRQKPIGEYIVDFYCPIADLVIEIDGDSHFNGTKQADDRLRDNFLIDCGLKVFRFDNHQVMSNLTGVVANIESEIG